MQGMTSRMWDFGVPPDLSTTDLSSVKSPSQSEGSDCTASVKCTHVQK